MSDLISREELMKLWDEYHPFIATRAIQFDQALRKLPTVDAEPVRHGQWIPCTKSGLILTEQLRREGISWYGFKCSACNCVRKGNALREAKYCPNCGARMDEE